MDGLIIKKKYLDLILDGSKVWEIRGSNITKRGTIALIQSGTNLIMGTAYLKGAGLFHNYHINTCKEWHQLDAEGVEFIKKYEKPWFWDLRHSKRFKKPVPYKKKSGPVIWVKDVVGCDNCKNHIYSGSKWICKYSDECMFDDFWEFKE